MEDVIEIQANFSDTSVKTRFNGSYDEALEYYVGNVFNVGTTEDENRVCLSVDLLK